MLVRITDKGITIDMSGAEARVLADQIGDMPARGREKVMQLHQAIENALIWYGKGAGGHGR